MPNQRDPKKALFSVSMDRNVLDAIEQVCREQGITRVDFLRQAAKELLEKRKADKENKNTK